MLHVQRKAGQANSGLEAGEKEFVEDNSCKARERHLQRLVMEDGDAEQRQREQDEIHGNAEHVDRRRSSCGRGRGQ